MSSCCWEWQTGRGHSKDCPNWEAWAKQMEEYASPDVLIVGKHRRGSLSAKQNRRAKRKSDEHRKSLRN